MSRPSNEPATRAVLLNAAQLNADGKLDLAPLEAVVDLIRYDTTDVEEIVERVQHCQILITKEFPLPVDTIKRLPKGVRLICEAGTGFNNIDIEAANRRGIVVCHVPDYSTSSVAQLTLSFILMMSTGVHQIMRRVASRDFEGFRDGLRFPHMEVQGKTLGVIGAGAIGGKVIQLARAFGMKVIVYNRSPRRWSDREIRQVPLHDLLATSDFVTLHVPLTEETQHLIRAETICTMKQGVYLVNAARGGLVNHVDLAEALNSAHIAGAALDVQEPEPLPPESELWSMENVILTPHIGWRAIEARQRLVEVVADNVKAFLKGAPLNIVTTR